MALFREGALDLLLSRKRGDSSQVTFEIPSIKPILSEELIILAKFVLFRIGGEWFALTVKVFSQITALKKILRLPLRKSGPVLGLVNINGQLRVAVSLKMLLALPDKEPSQISKRVYPRSVVIEKGTSTWVFPVEEVWGIEAFNEAALENVPKNAAIGGVSFLKYIVEWKGKRVGVIDDELLFYSLKRQI